jgi:hypothetical protein
MSPSSAEGARAGVAAAHIVQRQLEGLGADGLLGPFVERGQQAQGLLAVALAALDAEGALAPGDGHRQHRLQEAQMLVQRAAQVRQAGVVQRGKGVSQQHGRKGSRAGLSGKR